MNLKTAITLVHDYVRTELPEHGRTAADSIAYTRDTLTRAEVNEPAVPDTDPQEERIWQAHVAVVKASHTEITKALKTFLR
ncbi:hypothetical protein [Amycolatopsis sp. DSM 110486]|uniref:hypothetical protein n=1 Tax=Amycolatopsis sp. DSM 110486 TaxID=2865832 RepID=UPI001C6A5846|nr:hypothetical protein [Amycolatopsis sp. DSM 110486]QYN23159.1 hypothetical protein K1T34_12275 [Amycolatopsis sp. DSM 110486]